MVLIGSVIVLVLVVSQPDLFPSSDLIKIHALPGHHIQREIIQGLGSVAECQGGGDNCALTNNLDKP